MTTTVVVLKTVEKMIVPPVPGLDFAVVVVVFLDVKAEVSVVGSVVVRVVVIEVVRAIVSVSRGVVVTVSTTLVGKPTIQLQAELMEEASMPLRNAGMAGELMFADRGWRAACVGFEVMVIVLIQGRVSTSGGEGGWGGPTSALPSSTRS